MDLYTEAGLNAAISDAYGARELDEAEARAVASAWHSGQASAFYAFASSGAYTAELREDLQAELSRLIAKVYDRLPELDRMALDLLGTYFLARREVD